METFHETSMDVYFIRHGQTDYSLKDQKIYQGFGVNLAPLSEEGVRQIEETAKDPRLQGAELILTSPYTRAVQTAAILSRRLDLPIVVETDLHEWVANKHYIYEENEIAHKAFHEFMEHNGEAMEGVLWESAQDIRKRVEAVLKKYRQYHKIIVAGHGYLIQSMTGVPHPENGEICFYQEKL